MLSRHLLDSHILDRQFLDHLNMEYTFVQLQKNTRNTGKNKISQMFIQSDCSVNI